MKRKKGRIKCWKEEIAIGKVCVVKMGFTLESVLDFIEIIYSVAHVSKQKTSG